MLKKIGAIFAPKITPPVRLLGILGMSSPINHCNELMADFRDEPVPTTSPTYASGKPFCFKVSINFRPSGILLISMALACSGISGRLQASCAGLKSSVLVSPSTLNTTSLISSASTGLLVNHWASAHDCMSFLAGSLPVLASSATS